MPFPLDFKHKPSKHCIQSLKSNLYNFFSDSTPRNSIPNSQPYPPWRARHVRRWARGGARAVARRRRRECVREERAWARRRRARADLGGGAWQRQGARGGGGGRAEAPAVDVVAGRRRSRQSGSCPLPDMGLSLAASNSLPSTTA